MEHIAVTVYDMKTEAYLRPFFAMTTGEAIRTFTDSIADPQSMFNRHPADFTLFKIGVYDDSLGVLTSCPPENLGNALTYMQHSEGLPNGKPVGNDSPIQRDSTR